MTQDQLWYAGRTFGKDAHHPDGSALRETLPPRLSSRESSLATIARVSPHPQFDRIVHEPNRLQICALLTPRPSVDFADLRDELGIADAALSKHLKTLESAGYVVLRKHTVDGRSRTSASITAAGREAVCGHVSELQRLARVISPRPRIR